VTERPIPAYRRSAFQVALLTFATSGLYVFVWAFFVRRACAAILEREDQPIWKTIALIVPIFNFFLMFELGKRIEGVSWRADPTRSEGSLPWLGLSLFGFGVLGRLNGGYAFLGMLVFLPVAFMQRSFSRAQIALLGETVLPSRLHWAEWIVFVLGLAWWMLVAVGMIVSIRTRELPPDFAPWFFASLALSAAMLVVIRFVSARAIAEGLTMHSASVGSVPTAPVSAD
jgi:hypothetical protein